MDLQSTTTAWVIWGLIKKYLDWVHLSTTSHHTVLGLFWTCLYVFLHILNQQDLNATIQSNPVTTCKCHALYLWCQRPWNNACVSNFVQNLKKHEIKFMIWPWLPFKGRPWAILKFLSSCAVLKIGTHLQKMMSVLNIIHLSEMMKW